MAQSCRLVLWCVLACCCVLHGCVFRLLLSTRTILTRNREACRRKGISLLLLLLSTKLIMEEADLIAKFEPGIENQSESPRPSTPVRPSSPANEQPSDESSRRHDSSVEIPHKKDDDEEEHKDGAKKDSNEKRTNTYIGWTSSPNRSSPFPISKDTKDSKKRRDSGSSSDGEKDGRNMSRPHRTICALKISNETIGRILLIFLVVVFIVFCYSILADWSSYKCAVSEKKGNSKKRYPL